MQTLQYLSDLMVALPAALSRILLGMRVDPRATFLESLSEKATKLLGSLAFALMAGQIFREFQNTSQHATIAIIAAAFTAQDTAMSLVRKSRKKLKTYEDDN